MKENLHYIRVNMLMSHWLESNANGVIPRAVTGISELERICSFFGELCLRDESGSLENKCLARRSTTSSRGEEPFSTCQEGFFLSSGKKNRSFVDFLYKHKSHVGFHIYTKI